MHQLKDPSLCIVEPSQKKVPAAFHQKALVFSALQLLMLLEVNRRLWDENLCLLEGLHRQLFPSIQLLIRLLFD